jgi:hypothetical protein
LQAYSLPPVRPVLKKTNSKGVLPNIGLTIG